MDAVLEIADGRRVRRHTFGAMGTRVRVIAPEATPRARDGFADAVAMVERTFARLEGRFTRFRSDSELMAVNAAAGRPTRVSAEFMTLLELSMDAARRTGGLFDPTVLPALLAAGYDRDYADVAREPRAPRPTPRAAGRWSDLQVDAESVLLPEGVALDFGGIAKGWTADIAAEQAAHLLPWMIVDAGGDLRLVGEPPVGGLDVGVEDPFDPSREILRLKLASGALATSSVTRRSWGPGLHHLIDPRTWRPAATGILQATVWAESCTEAEVRSKWALLAGHDALDEIHALLVTDEGRLATNLAALDGAEVGA